MNKMISDSVYFLEVCALTAKRSPDPNTQCGAVIVKHEAIISTGYNSIPNNVRTPAERSVRPEKYLYYEHAERSAIYACARHGFSTYGATMYVTGVPCADCARAIIESGIAKVVYLHGFHDPSFGERWKASKDASMAMLEEARVQLYRIQYTGLTN